MAVRFMVTALIAVGVVFNGFSQTVTFNSPLPWVSLRNDTVTVRAQVDTGLLRDKKLSLTLASVKNGKKTVISSKTVSVKEPSAEFAFGKINRKLIGGEEYLQVSWEIKGGDEKGVIEPIGIADLSAAAPFDTVGATHLRDGISTADAASAVGDKFVTTGDFTYAPGWNRDALFMVVKKSAKSDTAKFLFDGKCGKNAFLSYPDRIVAATVCDPVTVIGVHYTRDVQKDSLKYSSRQWNSEITHEISGDRVVIRLPWFDTGIIPFEERVVGFGVVRSDAKGQQVAALPQKAQLYIPATWGALKLQK